MLTWEDTKILMRKFGELKDWQNAYHSYYLKEDMSLTREMSQHTLKILDAKYEKIDIEKVLQEQHHLSTREKLKLKLLLQKYEHLFNRTLGDWNTTPVCIEVKENTKPYHSRLYPVPQIYKEN